MKNQILKTESIAKDLIKFGLNPKEWMIRSTHSLLRQKTAIIENKHDVEFRFLGQLKNEGESYRIQGMTLLSY